MMQTMIGTEKIMISSKPRDGSRVNSGAVGRSQDIAADDGLNSSEGAVEED